MDCFIGIDLGSTTTKAVLMDADFQVLGQGITNSRSNYATAAAVATAGGAMAVAAYMKSSATAASWRASFAAPGGVTLASAAGVLGQVKLAPSSGVDPATWTLRSVLGYQTVAQ